MEKAICRAAATHKPLLLDQLLHRPGYTLCRLVERKRCSRHVVGERSEHFHEVDHAIVVGDVELSHPVEQLGARGALDVPVVPQVHLAQRFGERLQHGEERVRRDGEGTLRIPSQPDLAEFLDGFDRYVFVFRANVGEIFDNDANEEAIENQKGHGDGE
eukprot:scaffold1691_cov107-Isochrysis_galbana.AAC.10